MSATAKKLFADTIHNNAPAALNRLNEIRSELASTFGLELFDLFLTNIPTSEEAPAIGLDESGSIALGIDPAELGTLAIVITYADATAAGSSIQLTPQSAPIAVPVSIGLANLPRHTEMTGNRKLADLMAKTLDRLLLGAARKIFKGNLKDGRPLIGDRIQAMIAASVTSASGPERVYKTMFRIIQGALLKQVRLTAERLKDQKKTAQAARFLATYSAARLNIDIMQECFQSSEAAEAQFPEMPQSQWVKLLDFAIALSERVPFNIAVKDAEGNTIKDDKGKTVYTVEHRTLSPEIFLTWKATRDETKLAPDADTVTLPDLDVNEMLGNAA